MDDLNSFIQLHAYGIPQIKPDEKRAFLGNFRERVAMAVTVRQLQDPQIYQLLQSVLERYPQYRVYLNGRMSNHLIMTYLKQAQVLNYPFTVMAQTGMRVQHDLASNDFGWVLAHPTDKIERPILI
ncbi:DUF1694 domain-containing protein [Lacticaseibacillus brantae]|uniref:DUF1694 domain-containing protein n=1 Tax=Lacticaseibacillus brantae DSM 23927 TaxID=1423727 RepID=A0A0R2B8U4_9LACO|nr:DUF1694 domain-containing protein [Lacticaseibacillus brantae]KRM72923.1 hypothetical protein FC34_GL000635 [Lacticaseibacillus brantae DSM 23927]